MMSTSDEDAVSSERSFGTFALSARGRAGQLAPFAALVIPLDNEIRDAVNVMLTLGLEVALKTGDGS